MNRIDLTAVIIRVKEKEPQVLIVGKEYILPSGPYNPEEHRTLELGLRTWVTEQTGQELDFVEQLYTYGNWHREGYVTVGYYALVPYVKTDKTLPGRWVNIYDFFPWEDFRQGVPPILENTIKPEIENWIESGDTPVEVEERRERVRVNFNDFITLDMSRVLFRYEILYEAGIVTEAHRDWDYWGKDKHHRLPVNSNKIGDSDFRYLSRNTGRMMEKDHRRILASTLARVRGKIPYRPIVFKMLPGEFTLLATQNYYEGLTGRLLHKQNFRRYLMQGNYVEKTLKTDSTGPGRPAALYRFRREVEAERVNLGLNLPFRRG